MPRPYPFEEGAKYGRWTVVKTRIPGKQNTLVRCDCGTEKLMAAYHLTSGKSTQCRRCAGRNNPGNESRRKTGTHLAAYDKYTQYRIDKRGYEWGLTFYHFMKITQEDCRYCGAPPSNVNKIKKEWAEDFVYSGIDRYDNTRGYILGNVLPCCAVCNRMKRDLTYDEFIAHVGRINKRHPEGSALILAGQ